MPTTESCTTPLPSGATSGSRTLAGNGADVGPTNPKRRHPSAIPWGFVGTVVVVALIECLIGRNWLTFTDPVSLSWRYSAEGVKNDAPGCELLCLGDSLIKHGLLPSVLEKETGRRTVNLSAAREPTLFTYFLLRRALEAGARPRAIIINAKPAVLLAGPEFNSRYWEEVLTPRECVEFSLLTRNGPFMLATITGRLLPSLRSRLEIRSQLIAAAHGETDPIPAMNRVLLRNWTVNRGANVVSVHAKPAADDTEAEIEHRLHPRLFFVDPTNAAGMERLLQLAAAHQIPVLWLLTPLAPDLQERRDQSGAEAGYETFVRSYLIRYWRILTVLDARRGDYPATVFTDLTHLNRQGALALSHAVARTIRPLLDRPPSDSGIRWLVVERPSFDRPLEADALVEDLDQSRRALSVRDAAYFSLR
jgi:hypothetical protein